MRTFRPGESVVWRSVWRDISAVGTAWPGVVVQDEPDLIALYRPAGVTGKQRSGERGGPRDRLLIKWDGGYQDLSWSRTDLLILHRPGDMYSVWRAWREGTSELFWRYINLEEAWRRTPIGFDSKDLYLDLWAEPDSAEWHWKDDDEAAWSVERGSISAGQLSEARREGDRAVDRIRRREPPHDRDWDGWRPDPAWATPVLPEDWRDFVPPAR